ncbi:Cupin domain-containing protein [Chitinophaga niastensis]|uniref:Cupin domain-containing protein n=1 Tax=Chitinophaga niastensis TaxID=536980 RepID=A0A2P8HHH0_CHINA|nr:cupin domain-containing protein [Chitinophaga niastensis]PSL45673.1 Cupin domain-containing protein [Chitinophaga niastensis]
MKKMLLLIFIVFAGLVFNNAYGQDVCSTNPKYCKLLSDTAGVRMMLITLPPGAKLATHTHPVNMGYVVKGGLLKIAYDDGKKESHMLKAGDAMHRGPETPHHAWNAGKTTIELIFVEKME